MFELARDPFLLDPEKVEGDCVRVVGFEEFRALPERAPLSRDQLLAFGAGVLAKLGDTFEDDLFSLEPKLRAQLEVLVERLDLLDVLDDPRADGSDSGWRPHSP